MQTVSPVVRALKQDASDDPDRFWGAAAEQLPWFRRWDTVFDWQPPTFRWFIGGQTNLSYNCLDYHVSHGRAGHAALITEDERGNRRTFTYAQLLEEVKATAAALRGLGVQRGDRVAVYMPPCAEAMILLLALTRIGAIHLVVFAGFGVGALAERMQLSGACWLFAADITYRKGKDVDLTDIVRHAVDNLGGLVKRVVLLKRTDRSLGLAERELTWTDFLKLGGSQDATHEVMESNEPAFILATSGTTAKPKLVVHAHGPYQVHIASMARWVFGMRPEEVWWSTSDIGWIVGHSYMLYAPLLMGCTTLAYEGSLDHPGPETFYRTIEYNHVSSIFTSPTAVRLFMRYGAEVARGFDLSSLHERVFCAGEVLNPPAWEWLQREVLQDRIAVIDHMWQTETSGPIVGNPYGLGQLPIKPGSAGIPLPGIEGAIMAPDGQVLPPGEKGIFVVRRPFPGLTARLWGEPERYGPDYWQRIPGQLVYFVGDAAAMDEDGYVWFSGRADEIIKIAAHRIGTIEVESAFLRNPAVAEAGVTGRPDELRGEVIAAFVVLRQGFEPSDDLRRGILETVRQELGPVAVIGDLRFVAALPKTRSGKIMRRVLKAVATETEPGDISTIEDAGSVEEVRQAWQSLTEELTPAT
jgi:acetyl-CoA synthetase